MHQTTPPSTHVPTRDREAVIRLMQKAPRGYRTLSMSSPQSDPAQSRDQVSTVITMQRVHFVFLGGLERVV